VDEFQDTTDAQYRLLHTLSGSDWGNVTAVADDDQIIYEWNGASFKQLRRFQDDFSPSVVQLPTNFRCPPAIVESANRLVAYNVRRTATKLPLVAGKTELRLPPERHLQLRVFDSDVHEAEGIAVEIGSISPDERGNVAVLARARSVLLPLVPAFRQQGVAAELVERRDEFASPQFRWLIGFLVQLVRPLDRRNLRKLVDAFNRVSNLSLSAEEIFAESEATHRDYLTTWIDSSSRGDSGESAASLLSFAARMSSNVSAARTVVPALVEQLEAMATPNGGEGQLGSDLTDDAAAWKELVREINRQSGSATPLGQFLQELQMRSKAPPPKPDAVRLLTIHGAKGREFDWVFLIGLAEEIMPSYQSLQKGDESAEMEEERRGCFVAITRAKECLVLSHARTYRGFRKEPSRFLVEMGFAQ